MKHKQFDEWLQLSLYDELSEQERALLDNHITMCDKCRNELEDLKKLHSTLAHYKPAEVQEPLLRDARRSLRLRIHADSTQDSLRSKVKDALDKIFAPPLQIALGGVAVLALGILVGYFVFKAPPEKSFILHQTAATSSAMETGESQIANVRFLDRNAQTGDVEFTFETVTPVRVRGNVNDEKVQKYLHEHSSVIRMLAADSAQ